MRKFRIVAVSLLFLGLLSLATPAAAVGSIMGWTKLDTLELASSDIAVKGTYAYVSDKLGGITVVDISVPKNLRALRTVTLPGATPALSNTYPGRVFVSGNYLIGLGMQNIYVYSLANQAMPSLIQSIVPEPLDGVRVYTSDIQIVGTTAYVAAGSGLLIYDVSDMSAWSLLSTLSLPNFTRNVFASHGYVFIAVEKAIASEPTGWLYIVDVRTKSNPIVVKKIRTSSVAADVRVQWPFVYIADVKYLSIYNIARPTAPVLTQKKTYIGNVNNVIGTSDPNLLMYVRYASRGTELRSIRIINGSTARQSTLPALVASRVAFTGSFMYTLASSGLLTSYKLK